MKKPLNAGVKTALWTVASIAFCVLSCFSYFFVQSLPDKSLRISKTDEYEMSFVYTDEELKNLELVYAYRAGGFLTRMTPPKLYVAEVSKEKFEALTDSTEYTATSLSHEGPEFLFVERVTEGLFDDQAKWDDGIWTYGRGSHFFFVEHQGKKLIVIITRVWS